ncbi:MAG: peptidylprolyl isomerase [Pseudomonadota bacterium]
MEKKLKIRGMILHTAFLGITILYLLMFTGCNDKKKEETQTKNDLENAVVATVNSTPIYKKDIESGISKDVFGPILNEARSARLDHLIYVILVQQFMKEEGIEIKNEAIDQQIKELRKNPPTLGCNCCRYKSLEQFMEINNLNMSDLREKIRADMGLSVYIDMLWQKKYPDREASLKLVKENRHDLEMKYINVAHIFFNTFQAPLFKTEPDVVLNKKIQQAIEALKRLNKGENFAKVAREMSEDMDSRANGGYMGCIDKKLFGFEFERATSQLAPGEYSQPVQSPFGVHIITRSAMTDDDILSILKDCFKKEIQERIIKDLKDKAEIVRQ